MSTVVPTEAHYELARILSLSDDYHNDARLIAESEARAAEPMRNLTDKMCKQAEFLAVANRELIAERDQLKSDYIKLMQSCYRGDSQDVAASERAQMKYIADELRLEVEHEREAVKAFCDDRNAQRARAERAEAELAKERAQVHLIKELLQDFVSNDTTPRPNCSCHISPPCNDCMDNAAQRELVARATAVLSLSAIDAAMKEDGK